MTVEGIGDHALFIGLYWLNFGDFLNGSWTRGYYDQAWIKKASSRVRFMPPGWVITLVSILMYGVNLAANSLSLIVAVPRSRALFGLQFALTLTASTLQMIWTATLLEQRWVWPAFGTLVLMLLVRALQIVIAFLEGEVTSAILFLVPFPWVMFVAYLNLMIAFAYTSSSFSRRKGGG